MELERDFIPADMDSHCSTPSVVLGALWVVVIEIVIEVVHEVVLEVVIRFGGGIMRRVVVGVVL